MDADHLAANRAMWDERAPAHAASPDYRLARFAEDPWHISDVVRFDLPLLGSVEGRRGIHLQCHIGTDTVSLARLGARMTGLDFSPASLAEARRLATAAGAAVDFVESDVHSAVSALDGEEFDFVFTGIGALCWLPSVARWAQVVADLLRPGGRLFVREAHPMMCTVVPGRDNRLLLVEDPYYERDEPFVDDEDATYVETDVSFTNTRSYAWNHGLGETITALLAAGMEITGLAEHDSVPWQALPGLMEDVGGGEWRLIDRPERLPHSYTLQAVKRPAAR